MKIHIVKQGDTLYDLAKKYNVELNKLIAVNPQIVNPDEIDVGMKVKIPAGPKPLVPAEGTYKFKHVVKQGDSMWKLSKAWDVPLADLIGANPQLKNPNVLLTGEVVYIPKSASDAVETPSVDVHQPVATSFQEGQHPVDAQHLPPPSWAAEAPGPQAAAQPEWAGGHAGWPIEAPGLHAGYPPQPQEATGPAVESGMQTGSQHNPWTYESFMQSVPQAPLLNQPYTGAQGWDQQAAHPFAQANVPALEASTQQSPELPQQPGQPFEDYMHGYGAYPYFASDAAQQGAGPGVGYNVPPMPYPYSHLADCCNGPQLDMPAGFGAYGPSSLPYAAAYAPHYPVPYASVPDYSMPPMHSGYGPGVHTGLDPSLAYSTGWPGAAAPYMQMPVQQPLQQHFGEYGGIPSYPHGSGAVQLDEKEQDIDITIDENKPGVRTKGVSSAKEPKPHSQRQRLAAFLRSTPQRSSVRQEQRPNAPWINV